MTKPIFIFDGACSFCRRWINRWKKATGDAIDYAPYQEVMPRFPQINLQQFQSSVILIEPNGTISSGALAVFKLLSLGGKSTIPFWCYRNLPGFSTITEWGYRRVANNRSLFSKLFHH